MMIVKTGCGTDGALHSTKQAEVVGASVSMSVIGAIISVILLLVLALLLLAFAWHTRKWCFATPVVVLDTEKQG